MRWTLAAALCVAAVAGAQTVEEDYAVLPEHPRLLLRPQRLRLLRREKERQSPRWLQFETLMRGKAQMPEPGLALALFYQVTNEESFGRQAIEWALRPQSDLRQVALVFDWCQSLMDDAQRAQLSGRLVRGAQANAADLPAVRSRAFAAVALSGHSDDVSRAALRSVVRDWWRGSTAKLLRAGDKTISHTEIYPFVELLHAIRDNLQIEMRDDALPFFRDLPALRLLSYYPASYPAPENDYRIPFYSGKGDPDLRTASLTRAAEFAMVAYENNATEMQFLQGWLMHDRFVLRGAFGAPYEFLWANPYQPGLPFEKMGLDIHEQRSGTLLIRSSWEEDATWFGVSGGSMQMFREGKIQSIKVREPLVLGDAMVVAGEPEMRIKVAEDGPAHWFIVGLKPSSPYEIEADDEGLAEAISDRGGILSLRFTRKDGQSVKLRERKAP